MDRSSEYDWYRMQQVFRYVTCHGMQTHLMQLHVAVHGPATSGDVDAFTAALQANLVAMPSLSTSTRTI